jgi:hypothetical protein
MAGFRGVARRTARRAFSNSEHLEAKVKKKEVRIWWRGVRIG